MDKKNCWEVMKCGREPGGKNAEELGVCPASTDERLSGTHGGKHAGRACWVIAGTFCDSVVQGAGHVRAEVSGLHRLRVLQTGEVGGGVRLPDIARPPEKAEGHEINPVRRTKAF
jgi:hypothetical protein